MGEHYLDTVGVCGSIPHVPTKIALLILAACGSASPPRGPDLSKRLAAEEACDSVAAELPVPAGAGPVMMAAGERASLLCDLPERIIAVDASQRVENGALRVDGSVRVISRVGAQAGMPQPAIAIERSSPGCKQEPRGCVYQTSAPSLSSIETRGTQLLPTSGWLHGAEDLCRALPEDTIATCSTATRLAYVEIGCAGPTPLQLGVHDADHERVYDLDVEVPSRRRYGALDPASTPTHWTYRFDHAALSFELPEAGVPSATLELDGTREPCLAFAVYRR